MNSDAERPEDLYGPGLGQDSPTGQSGDAAGQTGETTVPAGASPSQASDVAGQGPGPQLPPPGWYPEGGVQRYWDGSQWTEHTAPLAGAPGPQAGQQPANQQWGAPGDPSTLAVSNVVTSDDRTMATLAHALGIFGGFIAPLIIWLIKKDQSPYVDDQGKEALNFQITLLIAWLITFVLIFVLIGLLLVPILLIAQIVLPIVAAVASNRGEYYRYPLTIRLIK